MYYLIGASGFVGRYIWRELEERGQRVNGTSYPKPTSRSRMLDVTDRDAVFEYLRQLRSGDVVILAAAQPNVERCEMQPEETARVNVDGTKHVVDATSGGGARLVFFSSEYVFDGEAGPYAEHDGLNPLNEYGKQKLSAEEYIACHLNNYLIIRTTTVFGFEETGRNFFMSLVKRMRSQERVLVPRDQISTPTYVVGLARISSELAERDISGVINVTGPDRMSRYQLARRMARAWRLDEDNLIPVDTPALKQMARRPRQAGLRTDKLRRMGYHVESVGEALDQLVMTYGQRIRTN